MKLHAKLLFTAISCLLALQQAAAQRMLGITTSEWSAINSVYLNPASIADCRETISIGILSLNFDVNNDLGTFSRVGEYSGTSAKTFKPTGTQPFSMLIPDVEIHGPGIMMTLSKKISLAFTTGFRVMNQLNNFDPSLYNLITNPGALNTNSNYSVTTKNFNWTAHMWSEAGLTFAAVVLNNEKNELKVGITVKRLGGIAYVSVTGKNIDMRYNADSQSVYASQTDLEFASNLVSDSAAIFKGLNASNLFDRIFGESGGGGMAADIGVIYKRRIGEAEPSDYMESYHTHDVVLSASITDLGAINYLRSTNADVQVTGNGYITGPGINNNSGGGSQFVNYAHQNGFNVDTVSRSTKVFLPAALLLSADVQVRGPLFANLLYIANLANRQNFGNSYYNQVTFTPRYDYHKMTLALPITYSMLSHDVKVGLGYRIAGFFIGSDDALAFFMKNQRGFDIYVGGYIPIFKLHNDPAGIHWAN